MSAQLRPSMQYRRMGIADLDAVMSIENVIYTHPWTRGNFMDSLAADSYCWVLDIDGEVAGYAVLNHAAGEAHLLNLSIGAAWQRRGLGTAFLLYIFDFIGKNGIQVMFLEVRVSNVAARNLYAQCGFREVGTRRDYYPALAGREDAIVLQYQP